MKASELIVQLQKAIASYGDWPVKVFEYEESFYYNASIEFLGDKYSLNEGLHYGMTEEDGL